MSFLAPEIRKILPNEIKVSLTFHSKNRKIGPSRLPLQALENLPEASRIYVSNGNRGYAWLDFFFYQCQSTKFFGKNCMLLIKPT